MDILGQARGASYVGPVPAATARVRATRSLPLLILGLGVWEMQRGAAGQRGGLDRPIAWADVADLDIAIDRGRVSTRLLLPEAPFPARGPGGPRVKPDTKLDIVTFTAGLPRGMTAQEFAELLGRYRLADAARPELAAEPPLAPGKD